MEKIFKQCAGKECPCIFNEDAQGLNSLMELKVLMAFKWQNLGGSHRVS